MIIRLAGAFGLIGIAALGDPARADLKTGVAAYKAGDYKTAFRKFSEDAAAGNANAQFNLAILYLTGRGVERDLAKAVEWHLKAAAQGLPAAEHGLGVFYYQGLGVKRDYAQALTWFKRAAAKGYADSEFNIGVMYFNSQGVQRDDIEVVKWVTLAAARKFAPAEYRMGQMYEKGVIFVKDLSAARYWYRLAKKSGNKNATAALARVAKALKRPGTSTAANAPLPASPPKSPQKSKPELLSDSLPAPKIKPASTSAHAVAPTSAPAEKTAKPALATAPSRGPAPAAALEWRVQFASFRTPAEAERAWTDLTRRAGTAIGEMPRIVARADLGDRGIYHRLQAGPVAGYGAAVDLCRRIREAVPKQECLPVRVRIR